jgi:hypothetical protein
MMKIINIVFSLMVIAVVSVSCETYDDFNADRETIVGFPSNSVNISGVPEGGVKDSNPIKIFASDVASTDRTFKILVVNDLTTTPSENYTFDPVVVIPAGSRETTFIFTAVDTSLTSEKVTVTLEIEERADVVSGGRVGISMKN